MNVKGFSSAVYLQKRVFFLMNDADYAFTSKSTSIGPTCEAAQL